MNQSIVAFKAQTFNKSANVIYLHSTSKRTLKYPHLSLNRQSDMVNKRIKIVPHYVQADPGSYSILSKIFTALSIYEYTVGASVLSLSGIEQYNLNASEKNSASLVR